MYLEIIDSESGNCIARAWRRDPAPRIGDRITYLDRTIGAVVERPMLVSGLAETGAVVVVKAGAQRVYHRHSHCLVTTYDLGVDVMMTVVKIVKAKVRTLGKVKRRSGTLRYGA
jgi:hypothetical protein